MIRRLITRFGPPTYCAECGWWTTNCPHQG